MTDGVFKGGDFVNRYKIIGTLFTASPLHIGDGGMMSDPGRLALEDGGGEELKFSTVITDVNNRAYIPGSTLKGNLRTWLTQIFTRFGIACINDEKRAGDLRKKLENRQDPGLKMAEYLFGSGINEGKLEFWNAPLVDFPTISEHRSAYLGYDNTRGTIILKSVAIDPATGTAAEKKLYNYEVVPEGAKFQLTVCGQNLSEMELGMLLFALQGFNSAIYPVTLGAMRSIGFGRFTFEVEAIYYLDQYNLDRWLERVVELGHAGYEGLDQLPRDKQDEKIELFKQEFTKVIHPEGD